MGHKRSCTKSMRIVEQASNIWKPKYKWVLFLYTMITSEKVLILSLKKKKSKQNHNQTKPNQKNPLIRFLYHNFKFIVILLPESFGCSDYGSEQQHLRMPRTPVPDNLNTLFWALKVTQAHGAQTRMWAEHQHRLNKIHLKKTYLMVIYH